MNSATSLLMSVSWPVTMPQWPCDMYSHRQTSPISSRPGTSRLMARAAFCTMPSSAHAPVAISSFGLRQAEEDDAGNAQRLDLGALLHGFVHREVEDAGHGAHFLAHAFAGTDEQRIDESFRAEAGFADERTHRFGATQAAGTISWECHNSKILAPQEQRGAAKIAQYSVVDSLRLADNLVGWGAISAAQRRESQCIKNGFGWSSSAPSCWG